MRYRAPHALLLITLASATPASASPLAARLRYLDGGSPRELVRGAMREDGRRIVTLFHPRTGAPIRASLGSEALVQLAVDVDPLALASLDLVAVRPVAPALRIWQVRSRVGEDGAEIAARLAEHASPLVLAAMPDLAFEHVVNGSAFTPPPNDPRYPGQWFFDRIGMNDAWARETGSASTTIVVVDNGCDLAHADLKDQLDPGYDAYAMDDDPSYVASGAPDDNHGTACAGLAAARTNNGIGTAGACPGCRLRCVRLLGPDGSDTPVSSELAAFQFAFDHDAAVVSNSWGYKVDVAVPDMLRALIEKLYDEGRGGKGTVVVFAAGNDDRVLGDDELTAVRGVVTVGAVNNFSELTSYSNHGPSLSVVSPTGTSTTDITGAAGSDPGDYTTSFSGTSSACPIVAGVFGLLASAAPDRTASALEAALFDSAKQSSFATPDATGHDDFYGRGEIRPIDALRLLAGEVLDGGTDAMSASDAGAPMSDAGCGCDLIAHAPREGAWCLVVLVLLVARTRRRSM